ncbi:11791_t:CDS:2 [Dentiscutata erythropus]|uniref:11791_t:CDS:1 n=1 Tax=Dentiscutata erythropus TaxID=1348616 RepID=A0A9N9EG74_9GLOM|nr:11791_t:CDS:2 [Dentiscutata erythropus]
MSSQLFLKEGDNVFVPFGRAVEKYLNEFDHLKKARLKKQSRKNVSRTVKEGLITVSALLALLPLDSKIHNTNKKITATTMIGNNTPGKIPSGPYSKKKHSVDCIYLCFWVHDTGNRDIPLPEELV